jgi:hypothetical protein
MSSVNRRTFLKVGGMGALAVTLLLPIARLVAGKTTSGTYSFRAMAALPRPPLPAFASYVLQGDLDLIKRTGTLSQNIVAGAGDLLSDIALPGHARAIQVTDVRTAGDVVYVRGVVDDRSQLDKNESPIVDVRLEPSRGMARAQFMGSELELKLIAF